MKLSIFILALTVVHCKKGDETQSKTQEPEKTEVEPKPPKPTKAKDASKAPTQTAAIAPADKPVNTVTTSDSGVLGGVTLINGRSGLTAEKAFYKFTAEFQNTTSTTIYSPAVDIEYLDKNGMALKTESITTIVREELGHKVIRDGTHCFPKMLSPGEIAICGRTRDVNKIAKKPTTHRLFAKGKTSWSKEFPQVAIKASNESMNEKNLFTVDLEFSVKSGTCTSPEFGIGYYNKDGVLQLQETRWVDGVVKDKKIADMQPGQSIEFSHRKHLFELGPSIASRKYFASCRLP